MKILAIKAPTIATIERIKRKAMVVALMRQIELTSERKRALHNTTTNKSEA